jgi:hypothetical protein
MPPAAFGPACVKTQKRPHVIPFKLDWVSSEVSIPWKVVIGLGASQMPDSLHLIFTSTIAFFKAAVGFSHGLGRKLPLTTSVYQQAKYTFIVFFVICYHEKY